MQGHDGIAPPSHGVADLTCLVDELRAARADVSLFVDGDLHGLPATTGATVYRIVQESLTNASRHAPGSRVQVRVATHDGRVDIDVENSGSPHGGSGLGLANMQERAEAVGGTLHAGPGGEGWLVHASLPRAAPACGDAE